MNETPFQILKDQIAYLRSKYPFSSLALFGSVNRADFDPQKSDIDILIDFQSSDFSLFLELATELEELLNRKVDLVTKRSLKPRQMDYLKDQLRYV